MGTKAIVAKYDGDVVSSIRVDWDGYPGDVGKSLFYHYQDENKIDELLALGNLAILDTDIGDKITPNPYLDSKYDTTQTQCVSYIRDYEFDKDYALHCETRETPIMKFMFGEFNTDIEWVYLHIDGEWYFAPRDSYGKDFLLNDRPLIRLNKQDVDGDTYGLV